MIIFASMPNFQTLYHCNFYFLIIIFLGKNWGQKLTKSEIICVNLWSFLCFWRKFFGEMGSPAPLMQHMWNLDNFLTFSYDCTSFDCFQKKFFVNFWSFFYWPCQYLNHYLEMLCENAKLLKSDLSLKNQLANNDQCASHLKYLPCHRPT